MDTKKRLGDYEWVTYRRTAESLLRARGLIQLFQALDRTLVSQPGIRVNLSEMIEKGAAKNSSSPSTMDPPGYTIGQEITLSANQVVEAIDADSAVAMLAVYGLNYHELGHALYTPSLQTDAVVNINNFRDYMSTVAEGEFKRLNVRTDANNLATLRGYASQFGHLVALWARNVLEDQRLEHQLIDQYNRFAYYFAATAKRFVVSLDKKERIDPAAQGYLLTMERRYLPAEYRADYRDAFKKYLTTTSFAWLPRGKKLSDAEAEVVVGYFEKLANDYVGLTIHNVKKPLVEGDLATSLTIVRDWACLMIMYELVDSADMAPPCSSTCRASLNKDLQAGTSLSSPSAPAPGSVPTAPKPKDGPGLSSKDKKKVKDAQAGASKDKAQAAAKPSAPAPGPTTPPPAPHHAPRALGGKLAGKTTGTARVAPVSTDTLDKLLVEGTMDKGVIADIKQARTAMEKLVPLPLPMPNTVRAPDEVVTTYMRTQRNAIRDRLMEFEDKVEQGWDRGTDNGRINIGRVMAGEDYTTVYDAWREDKSDALDVHAIIMVDRSGSMSQRINSVCQSLWVFRSAFATIGAKIDVIAFCTEHHLMFDSDSTPKESTYERCISYGGTDPYPVLQGVEAEFAASEHRHKVLIMLTDGAWGNGVNCDRVVERIGRVHNTLTASVFLDMGSNVDRLDKHNAERAFAYNSKEPELFTKFCTDVVTGMIEKGLDA